LCAMPSMAVFCTLILCIPCMLLRYFLNDLEVVQVAPVTAGITSVFTCHMCCICSLRSLYFRIFWHFS
jgi:hypothetical protein